MVRADFLILGYRKLRVSPEKLDELSSILLRNKIASTVNSDGTVDVRNRDYSKVRDLILGRIEFTVSDPRGLLGLWIKQEAKLAIIIALIISIVILTLSSSVVWDIRPIGNEKIPDSEIIRRLSECGLSIGDKLNYVSLSEVEGSFLNSYNDVGWINLNRRGQVIYVSLIEKETPDELSGENIVYSNIVASCDCVIEEISVISGTAVVKVGDSVKKGDLLILGATNSEVSGEFCRAQGNIIGRVGDLVSVSVDRESTKTNITERRLLSLNVNIFKKSINIFKTYRNLTNECDIIENVKEYSLPGGARLPVSLSLCFAPVYEEEAIRYSDDEMIKLAKDRLNLKMASYLSNYDLIRISTSGEFTEEGYTLSSRIQYTREVGVENSFDISD